MTTIDSVNYEEDQKWCEQLASGLFTMADDLEAHADELTPDPDAGTFFSLNAECPVEKRREQALRCRVVANLLMGEDLKGKAGELLHEGKQMLP